MSDHAQILLIEPEISTSRMIASSLEKMGHRVFAFESLPALLGKALPPFQIFVLPNDLDLQDIEPVLAESRSQGKIALIYIAKEGNSEPKESLSLQKPIDPVDICELVQAQCQKLSEFQKVPDKPRILIVDDNDYVLDSAIAILEDDYETHGTLSALEGLKLLAQSPFEILLVDLMMDEMHGMDLVHEAKAENPNLIAIVMTGYSSKEAAIRAIKEGANDYLEKPLTPEAVRESIGTTWEKLRPRLHKNSVLQQVLHTSQEMVRQKDLLEEELQKQKQTPAQHPQVERRFAEDHEGLLIDELLSFTSNQELNRIEEHIICDKLLAEVLKKVQEDEDCSRVEWKISSLPEIMADPYFLREALAALLKNAVRSVSQVPNPCIEISASQTQSSTWNFEIWDNGKRKECLIRDQVEVFEGKKADIEGDALLELDNARRNLERLGARAWARELETGDACFGFEVMIQT
jgi:DNA-binding response OmpR family regulator